MDTSEKYIRMCEAAKEIQYKWGFQPGDFVYDPALDQVQIHLYNPPGDFSDYVWLPRQDQLQEMSVQFFMQNMSMSRFEALVRFLEWDVGCRQEAHRTMLKNSIYGFIDTVEEIMLESSMNMWHWKKWDGSKWDKIYEGYVSKNA